MDHLRGLSWRRHLLLSTRVSLAWHTHPDSAEGVKEGMVEGPASAIKRVDWKYRYMPFSNGDMKRKKGDMLIQQRHVRGRKEIDDLGAQRMMQNESKNPAVGRNDTGERRARLLVRLYTGRGAKHFT